MNTDKATMAGIAAIVIVGLFVSPVQAHRKYRIHHKGLPRKMLVRHSQNPSESTKSTVKIHTETKDFDLFKGVTGIATGTLKTLVKVVEAVFGGAMEQATNHKKHLNALRRINGQV